MGFVVPSGTAKRATAAPTATKQIRSGTAQLVLLSNADGQIGLRLHMNALARVIVQNAPLAVEVVDPDGKGAWLMGSYSGVTSSKTELRAVGTLTTPNGSRFRFNDNHKALPAHGTFEVARQVTVEQAAPLDLAFNSRFSLESAPSGMSDHDFFAPPSGMETTAMCRPPL